MGDRVSISFINGDSESVAFFSHWDGMNLVEDAKEYVRQLDKERPKTNSTYPIDRRQPNTVMADFLSVFLHGERVISNYHLGEDKHDGDNSDNGHHQIRLDE